MPKAFRARDAYGMIAYRYCLLGKEKTKCRGVEIFRACRIWPLTIADKGYPRRGNYTNLG